MSAYFQDNNYEFPSMSEVMQGIIQEEFSLMHSELIESLSDEQIFEAMYIKADSWKQIFHLSDAEGFEDEKLTMDILNDPKHEFTQTLLLAYSLETFL